MNMKSCQNKARLNKIEATSSFISNLQREIGLNGEFILCTIVAETHLYKVGHYTWPGSYIKTALPKATVFSLGPENWGCCLPDSVFLDDPWAKLVSFCVRKRVSATIVS